MQYGEGLARLLTRKLGLAVAARETEGPGREPQADRIRRDPACVRHARHRAAGLERQRRVDRRKAIPQRAGAVSDVRHAVPVHRAARCPDPVGRGARRQAGRHRSAGRHRRHLHAAPVQGAQERARTTPRGAGATSQRSSARASSTRWSPSAACRCPRSPTSRRRDLSAALRSTPSQTVAVRLALPEIAPSIIAAGTYPSLRRNYRTVGMYNFAVGACRPARRPRLRDPRCGVRQSGRDDGRSIRRRPRPCRRTSRATRCCRSTTARHAGTTTRRRSAWCAAIELRRVGRYQPISRLVLSSFSFRNLR